MTSWGVLDSFFQGRMALIVSLENNTAKREALPHARSSSLGQEAGLLCTSQPRRVLASLEAS